MIPLLNELAKPNLVSGMEFFLRQVEVAIVVGAARNLYKHLHSWLLEKYPWLLIQPHQTLVRKLCPACLKLVMKALIDVLEDMPQQNIDHSSLTVVLLDCQLNVLTCVPCHVSVSVAVLCPNDWSNLVDISVVCSYTHLLRQEDFRQGMLVVQSCKLENIGTKVLYPLLVLWV